MPFRIRWFFVQLHFVKCIFQNFKLALISLAIPLGNVLIALLIKMICLNFLLACQTPVSVSPKKRKNNDGKVRDVVSSDEENSDPKQKLSFAGKVL